MFFNKVLGKFRNDILKKVSYNFIFYSLNLILVYLLAIVITKYYGAETYGRYSIIKSMIMVLIIFNSLGLNTNAIRLSAHKDYFIDGIFKSDYFIKSYKILFLLSLLITIVILFYNDFIAIKIFKDIELESYLKIFPLVLFFSVFLNFNSNVLKGQGKILVFSFVSSFLNNFIFFTTIVISYLFLDLDEKYLMLLLAFSFFVAYIISLVNVLPFKKSMIYKKISYSELIKDSFPMMLSSTMIFLIFSLDTLMIGYFETSDKVGVYRVVSQISAVNGTLLIIFSSVVGPKISNYYSRGLDKDITKIIKISSKIILSISLPILLFILFFHKNILLFFGNEFLIGKTSIIILSICQFFYGFTGLVDLLLNMTKKQVVFGRITIIAAIANIILNLILIPLYGINGAAIATGFSLVLTNSIASIYVKKKYGFYPFYLPFKK